MDRLITATGKEYPCSFFGVVKAAGILYTNVEIDFQEAFQVFSDPKETSVLKYVYEQEGEECERVIRGATVFIGAERIFDNADSLRISLRRAFAEE